MYEQAEIWNEHYGLEYLPPKIFQNYLNLLVFFEFTVHRVRMSLGTKLNVQQTVDVYGQRLALLALSVDTFERCLRTDI